MYPILHMSPTGQRVVINYTDPKVHPGIHETSSLHHHFPHLRYEYGDTTSSPPPTGGREECEDHRHLQIEESGVTEMEYAKGEFNLLVDVKNYTRDELTVGSSEHWLFVEGSYAEERTSTLNGDFEEGVRLHFKRRFPLAPNARRETATCILSSDGVLRIRMKRDMTKGIPSTAGDLATMDDGDILDIPIEEVHLPMFLSLRKEEP